MMNLRILFEFSIFFHCVCTVFPPNLRHPTSKLLKMEKSPTEAVVFTSSCVRKNRWGWVKLPIAILLPYLGNTHPSSSIIHPSTSYDLGYHPGRVLTHTFGPKWRPPLGGGDTVMILLLDLIPTPMAIPSIQSNINNRNQDQFFNVTDGHLQWYNTVRRLLILTSWLSLSWTGFHPTPITKSLSLHKVRIKSL